jgi:glycosyltransferase involved in cell wall biosynthesis
VARTVIDTPAPDRRVCIVAPSSRLVGGQATSARRLIQGLTRDGGVDIHFVPIDPELPRWLHWVRKVPFLRTIVHFPFYLASLLAATGKADVFHVFSASYWSFVVTTTPAIVIGKLFGKPVMVNYRSGEAEDHLEHWPTARWLCRRVDAIVVPSGYLVDVFGKFGIEAISIPNFVELDVLPYRERNPLQAKFLSNRNHEELYNVSCVVRAFASIQRERPDASLKIVGGGSLTPALRREVGELRLSNVEFTGLLDKAAMRKAYDDCDICLNTPNIDNMPSTLLEASACGLAIVSSDVGGIPYIVEDEVTALLTGPDDPQAIAKAALRLLDEPGLASSLTRAARAEVERHYAWREVGSRWRKLYDALVSGRGGADLDRAA